MSDPNSIVWHGTTILSVRKGGRVVLAGDGQVSMGATIVKSNARKADHRVESVINSVEKRVEVYERQLPGKTRDLVQRARTTGQDARGKVRAKVFTA